MKKLPVLFLICIFAVSVQAQIVVSGSPYVYTANLAGTGIEKVYLLNTLNNATITYSSSAISVFFYRYSNSLSDKERIPDSEISVSSSGGVTTYTISNLLDSRGYLVEENGGTTAPVWLIDYSMHQPILSSIEVIENEDRCENLKLLITKSDELAVNGVSGNRRNIQRRYTLSYNDLRWDESNRVFRSELVEMRDLEIGTEIVISAPLVNTQFDLTGDQFAGYFNMAKKISSLPYTAVAVELHIIAEMEARNAPNEIKTEGGLLGGSAPVTINFYGYANEPVAVHYTWFIYNKHDMNNAVARYTDRDIKYTFLESGEFLVQLEVADRNSICVDTVSVSVNITESYLDVPNYFSPGSSSGANNEFRVAYKSLIKFKCTIFNRWGTKIYQWTDPSRGWDGRYKGKYVPTGVYFYVIEAEGSDGIKYKKGGDINILRSR
jgi:gliding motility-associated-like protein